MICPVMNIWQRLSGLIKNLFVKDADIKNIAKEKSLFQGVALNADMMKVQLPEQCLISVNFHC